MAMVDGEDGATRPPDSAAGRPRPDRRAEALRSNLKRRKAQTRARAEAPPDDPEGAAGPDAPDRASDTGGQTL